MQILFEDEYILIVSKPSDLLVHHSHYARNIEELSLVELLNDLGKKVYPVHRLDRKTSGVLLCVKEKSNVAIFQSLFESQKIEKKYRALLRGHVTESGVIDSPVKNDRGNYKEAETHYSCLHHLELLIPVEPYPTSRYSLVEFSPKTGRMHQLRIHANKISHPIIGDPKYGNRHHNHMFIERFGINHLFLHARSLKFIHPFTKLEVEVQAPMPDFWKEVLRNQIADSIFFE
jgi:tRNA pseudouridine65 synthase